RVAVGGGDFVAARAEVGRVAGDALGRLGVDTHDPVLHAAHARDVGVPAVAGVDQVIHAGPHRLSCLARQVAFGAEGGHGGGAGPQLVGGVVALDAQVVTAGRQDAGGELVAQARLHLVRVDGGRLRGDVAGRVDAADERDRPAVLDLPDAHVERHLA